MPSRMPIARWHGHRHPLGWADGPGRTRRTALGRRREGRRNSFPWTGRRFDLPGPGKVPVDHEKLPPAHVEGAPIARTTAGDRVRCVCAWIMRHGEHVIIERDPDDAGDLPVGHGNQDGIELGQIVKTPVDRPVPELHQENFSKSPSASHPVFAPEAPSFRAGRTGFSLLLR